MRVCAVKPAAGEALKPAEPSELLVGPSSSEASAPANHREVSEQCKCFSGRHDKYRHLQHLSYWQIKILMHGIKHIFMLYDIIY